MQSFITVDKLESDFGLSRNQAVAILKAIASKRVGDFKCGRKGWPSRLQARAQG